MTKLIWTKHAIGRGYTRLGRYGMDKINNAILKNLRKARPDRKNDGSSLIPFKMGKLRCMAVVIEDEGSIVIKTIMDISQQQHRVIFSHKGIKKCKTLKEK